MKKTIHNSKSLNNNKNTDSFDIEYPSVCPICEKSGVPTYIGSHFIENASNSTNLFCIFFCHNCEKVFIGNYFYTNYGLTHLVSYEPRYSLEEKTFPKYIKEISPTFCDIYNQAFASQQYSLNEISGMGYRKALEFLVKDYAIFLNENEKDKIATMPLSLCINQYIDSKRIKKLALASAWIGNDETHYIRKLQDYDIDTLIEFIEATLSFISSDLSAIRAESLIESQNKK